VTTSIWAGGRYEAVAERIAGIAAEVVASVAARVPLRDAAVVDLACGTGSAALAAAEHGARVTAVDVTAELIDQGRRKPGGRSVTWVTADAADTGLPARSFDAVVSNMGIIFVEPHRQVTELARLSKPGAVLGISSWVRAADNPLFTPVAAALGPQPQPDHTPDQWGQADVIHARLSPDFDDIGIESGSCTWGFESLAAAVHFVTQESPMHVALFARTDAAKRTRLRSAFESALSAHAGPTGTVSFAAPYVVVTARRR
jgi:SAM-dependent methyltransferase